MSAQTGACCGAGWLSFRRIVYIPFDACMAALEGLLREGNHGEAHVGQSRLRRPIKHDRRSGTCQIEVRLARGPLRPALRMRLNIDCWSPPPSSTALELIPRRRVRASASYFRAGHLLMDSLIHSLQLEREMQALDRPAGEEPETGAVRSGSRSAALPGSSHRLASAPPGGCGRQADSPVADPTVAVVGGKSGESHGETGEPLPIRSTGLPPYVRAGSITRPRRSNAALHRYPLIRRRRGRR